MMLMMYNQKICKEFLLPNLHDSDYSIYLYHDIYRLRRDIELRLEKSAEGWSVLGSEAYEVEAGGAGRERYLLKNQDIIDIKTRNGERFQVIAADVDLCFRVMDKYDLRRMKEVSIGKGAGNLIRHQFRELVSASHATLKRHSDGWYLTDMSKNGVFCQNQRVYGTRKLAFGERIDIFGLHLIFLGQILAVGAYCGESHIREDILRRAEKKRGEVLKEQKQAIGDVDYFHRSPRNLPVIYREKVEIEGPPSPKTVKQKPMFLTIGPAFTMAIPMMLGCGFAIFGSRLSGQASGAFMYTGMITAICSALIGVMWALLNLGYSKRENVEEENQRFNAYSNYLVQTANSLRAQYKHNAAAMLAMYPSAGQCMQYDRNSNELWNRNHTHEDFLYQRLGVGDLPFQVEIQIPKEKFTLISDALLEKPGLIRREFSVLHQVPLGLSLLDKRMIGLVGGAGKNGAIEVMHALAAGIAASHCYTDVKLVFIYRESERDRQENWECMRWFPHVWSEDKSTRYMASNKLETSDIFFELSNVVRRRSQNTPPSGREKRTIVKPHYVLFISDPSILEGEILTKYIYEAKPEYGMTTFLMVENLEELPNECEDVIENDQYFQGLYNLLDTNHEKCRITLDKVDRDGLEKFGKTLANIQVNEVESTSEIPGSLDFLEMYGVTRPEELNVLERWRKNRNYHSMKVLIGKKAGNADCYLDVHEKFHGPHGLVAGTTGSGKSETLQTYIMSLAVNFSPEDVSFFIIDFKGGGMANLFTGLPHLAGQISNLSGNQIRRAMISIKSENTRRQRIFSEYGVNNINLYTRLYKNHEAEIPIPHLFIVVDEFAELKKEEPEFMKELISVAQVGRSLGVHLILATQKPGGGTVDDNIWSNSKFRLCLRVQDRQDSNEMLHKPDAAFITQAGRCYLQVGNDEIYDLFQSGYSGAVYDEDANHDTRGAVLLTRTGKAELIGGRRLKASARKEKGVKEVTQLMAVITHLDKVAKENYGRLLSEGHNGIQLWLPELAKELHLHELPGYNEERKWDGWSLGAGESRGWKLEAMAGMYDDPENQEQNPLFINFSEDGHLAVCGFVASGKSTFLQTMVYSFLHIYKPSQLQMYLLDFSSHMLAPFESAPHVGGVIFDNQEERLAKFMHMLMKLMDERKTLFRGGSYGQYIQVHGETLPAVVVVIDNVASFREKSKGAYDEQLLRVAREGVGYGVFLAVTAAGPGMLEIPSHIWENIRTVISLGQSDKFKYGEVLRQVRVSVLPEADVRGRGLALVDGRILEFQTARCLKAKDDFARGKEIERECREMSDSWEGEHARMIPEIPSKPIFASFVSSKEYREAAKDKRYLPLGFRMDDASVYSVNLADIYCYAVSGRSRTGKTNVLKILLYAAVEKQGEVCVIERGTGELKKCAAEYGARYVTNSTELFAFLSELLPEFARRNKKKQAFLENGVEEEELFDKMSVEKPIFLFLADVGDFFQMAYKPDEGVNKMSGFIENIMEKGRHHHIYIIGCLKAEEESMLSVYKAYKFFAAYKKGVHLGGNLSEQKIFDFRNLSYDERSGSEKKGMAYVPEEEEENVGIRIVIPHVKKQNDSHAGIG